LPVSAKQETVLSIGQLLAEKGESVPCKSGASECADTDRLSGDIVFYSTLVSDKNRGTQKLNLRASTLSIFDQDLRQYNIIPETGETFQMFTLNRFNFDATHQFLIPRAVAYSAGLINYFFRGRLDAVDAAFSNQGITLKVKNVIDARKEPKLAEEILYSVDSSLVIAYQYKVDDREFFGTSLPVSLNEDIKPGQPSVNFYSFVLSEIPENATNIQYRLVFRGKLGSEVGAVAVGNFKLVSGFLIAPNYLPTDGVGGDRLIQKKAGEWKLSKETGVVAGNIDWKGWYVDGKPSKVLSWRGPKYRYFQSRVFDSRYDFSSEIYQNGEIFAIAPSTVLGAAITKDTDNNEWLIAISQGDVVYRRPNKKSDSQALFNPVTAPEGWQDMGRFIPDGVTSTGMPWFFNSKGTEAQTLRRKEKIIIENGQVRTEYNGLDRLRATIDVEGVSAKFENLKNLSGTTVTNNCERTQPVFAACTDVEIFYKNTTTRSGDYIVAVDYKFDAVNNGDREVLAVVSDSRSRLEEEFVQLSAECSMISSRKRFEMGELRLKIGPDSFILSKVDQAEILNQKVTVIINFFNTLRSGDINDRFNTEFTAVNYFDLRYNLVSSANRVDLYSAAGSVDNVPHEFSIPANITRGNQIKQELKSDIENKLIWSKTESSTDSANYSPSSGISVQSCSVPGNPDPTHGTSIKTEFPDNLDIISSIDGAWQIASNNNIFVSQKSLDPNLPYFNYLTGGDPMNVIPGATAEPHFYPIMLIK
jgi:hypothetical protein